MYQANQRLERLARTVPHSNAVLKVIEDHVDALVANADKGIPPAAAISDAIARAVPRDVVKSVAFRQYVGIAIHAALQQRGYERVQAGVRLRGDAIFTTGSTYRAAVKQADNQQQDFLKRFVSCLTPDEVAQLKQILNRSAKGRP